ncbi:MAG: ABC transporter permease [Anaerolineae bacterium]|nr:ABC transporter permease [Anaerolineae bacterium]
MQSLTATLTRFRYRLAEFSEVVALISFLAVFLFFAVAADHFLTSFSIANILTFASITGIVTVGVAMLMISGEFDMSVGSIFAVASYVFVLTLNAGVGPIPAMLLALLASAVLGLINGLIVTGTGIPSFMTTLGTMLAYRGIARALGSGLMVCYKEEKLALFDVLNGPINAINQLSDPPSNFRVSILWFIVIAIVISLVLMRTRYGNWVFATGGNPGAALAQGVAVKRVKVINFVLTGLLAGTASVMQFAHRLSVDPLRGKGMELIAVAACAIGGVRLTGGYGTILGACVGMLLLQMLEQGLVLMHVPVQIFQAVAGLILIVAVISNTYLGGRD